EGPGALDEVRLNRIKAVYSIDEAKMIRRSHENPAIQELYREFLGTPNGERAHHLLHTHYTKRTPVGVRKGK
ncbi:MAG TPA: iron hydrogenase small subunit, partial [Symbiobacteriaceae bacterium]|nr:iron hydrogenase small subunit [Symbiobacteriaceae bacterium]